MAFAATPAARPAHPYAHLLTRYVAGCIAEAQLDGVSDLLDASDASTQERLAFAGFFLDAANEGDVRLPDAAELADFLALARA